MADQPREHPGTAAAQRARVEAGPLHRLPGRFEQQPVLRVHGERLAR